MGKKDSLDYDAEIQKMEERLDKLTEGIRMEESRIGGKLDDLMRAVRHNNCKVEHVNRDIRNSRQSKQKPTANMSESDAIMKQLGKVYGTRELAENLDEKHSMVHTSVLDISPVSDDDQVNQSGAEECPSSAAPISTFVSSSSSLASSSAASSAPATSASKSSSFNASSPL
ncbi:hypothetical protein WR25_00902 [Diploscapter pachys]|uniref:Uncharacterized protein n=1 Tax=Diploscapter pachys TaxID=2018661 RepID=A0A2A2KW49_9BILA|nr:hypothetical protein WR25_00902 [Diploscapter pachys]